MIEVIDRIPKTAGKVKIVREDTGEEISAIIERADEPTVEGTKINKALFDSIKSDMSVGFAPINHASTSSTYGLATSSLYGHVRNRLLSQSYTVGDALECREGTLMSEVASRNSITFTFMEASIGVRSKYRQSYTTSFPYSVSSYGGTYSLVTANIRAIRTSDVILQDETFENAIKDHIQIERYYDGTYLWLYAYIYNNTDSSLTYDIKITGIYTRKG